MSLRQTVQHMLNNALERWNCIVQRHRVTVIVFGVILALAAAIYTQQNISINTDTEDMLSAELDWRQLDRKLAAEFPQFVGGIVIVVEAKTPDQAHDAADALYQKLQGQANLFTSVFSLHALPFIERAALLYLDQETLLDTTRQLANMQPLLTMLANDSTLRGLFALVESILTMRQNGMDGMDDTFAPLIDGINTSLVATLDNHPHQFSWQQFFAGEAPTQAIYREFIFVQATLDYAQLFPATSALQTIRTFADDVGITDENGLRLRLTGTTTLAHEELSSVMTGTEIAVVGALIMITVIMVIGLGSLWLVLATLITLVVGLFITAAWATLTVGELNLISVVFTVLYIGLGVDFAIHYCLRFREYRLHQNDTATALSQTSKKCGRTLLLCAITTAIGFFAFIPTDYQGIAELGWISGCGMFISFAVTITLLPALLTLVPIPPLSARTYTNITSRLLAFPVNYAKQIIIFALIMLVPLLWIVPKLTFDPHTLNLQNPHNESVETYLDLLQDSATSPLTAEVLVDTPAEAIAIENALKKLKTVDQVIWAESLIPDDQTAKLAVVEKLKASLSGIDLHQAPPSITTHDRHSAVRRLSNFLDSVDDHAFNDVRTHLRTLLERYASLDAASGDALLMDLEKTLLGSLPGRFKALETSLSAHSFTRDDLPLALKRRWISENQRYLVQIFPAENLADKQSLTQFVDDLQAAVPEVTGATIVSVEAGKAVVSAFWQAFATAIVAIMIVLLVLLNSRKAPWLIILPLVFASLLTAAAAVLFGLPLNFANIIALPLLFGIGVDSGIHILHRYQTEPPDDGVILATSSARAVLVSALTTIVSIGNLAFSPHLGTASMGKLLTLGIIMTLVCTLIILPGLLVLTDYKQRRS